jgi:hypothetical protein
LSAACGFRVFVPLLVMNLAVLTGHLHLSPGFEWIGSYYATATKSNGKAISPMQARGKRGGLLTKNNEMPGRFNTFHKID